MVVVYRNQIGKIYSHLERLEQNQNCTKIYSEFCVYCKVVGVSQSVEAVCLLSIVKLSHASLIKRS